MLGVGGDGGSTTGVGGGGGGGGFYGGGGGGGGSGARAGLAEAVAAVLRILNLAQLESRTSVELHRQATAASSYHGNDVRNA